MRRRRRWTRRTVPGVRWLIRRTGRPRTGRPQRGRPQRDRPYILAVGRRGGTGGWRCLSGAACFRTYGGLGFFHGGASLQEWIIPCVTVEWPSQAQPVNVTVEPAAQVLSQRPRVTLLVRRGSLLVEDAIARQVDVVIRDARSRTILFRSPVVAVTPDREEVAVALTVVEGSAAPRGTPLRIEVRDGRTEEVLDAGDSVLVR